MDNHTLFQLIREPAAAGEADLASLEQILTQYPYFTAPRFLLVKALYAAGNEKYFRQLRLAALYAADRRKLFGLIHPEAARNLAQENIPLSPEISAPGEQFPEVPQKIRSKVELIEKFIEKEPRLTAAKKDVNNESPLASKLAEKSLAEDDDIISETLAEIFVRQGNITKAIKIFAKLSLKYPEKSSYFAQKIEDLKNNYPTQIKKPE